MNIINEIYGFNAISLISCMILIRKTSINILGLLTFVQYNVKFDSQASAQLALYLIMNNDGHAVHNHELHNSKFDLPLFYNLYLLP